MEKISSINFCAHPLYKKRIKKYDAACGKFKKKPAVFVALDGKNKGDIEAIKSVVKNWEDTLFTKRISTVVNWMQNNRYIKVFALTEQTDNFEELNPSKILGLAEMREMQENGNELSHLQVKPSAININKKSSEYKKVGSTMLSSLKKMYSQFVLESVNDKNTENFYKHNGLIEYADTRGFFIWYKNIFKRLDLRLRNFIIKHGII